MDEEKKLKEVLRKKFLNYRISVDELDWNEIESRLPGNNPQRSPFSYLAGMAASILLIISFLYLTDKEFNLFPESAKKEISLSDSLLVESSPLNIHSGKRDSSLSETPNKETNFTVQKNASEFFKNDLENSTNTNQEKQLTNKSSNSANKTISRQWFEYLTNTSIRKIENIDLADRFITDSSYTDIAEHREIKGDIHSLVKDKFITFKGFIIGARPGFIYNYIKPFSSDPFLLTDFQNTNGLSEKRLGIHLSTELHLLVKNRFNFYTGITFSHQNYLFEFKFRDLFLDEIIEVNENDNYSSIGLNVGYKFPLSASTGLTNYLDISFERLFRLNGDDQFISGNQSIINIGYEVQMNLKGTSNIGFQPTFSYALTNVATSYFNANPYWFGFEISFSPY